MKKVVITLLFGCLFLVSGNANSKELIQMRSEIIGRNSSDGPKITITVEIGVPIICTLDWSICKIDIGVSFLAATAGSFPDGGSSGDGSGGGGGGSWKLYLPRENFSKYYPGFLNKLDGKTSVTFNNTYTLPSNVQDALGSKKLLVIQANVAYPLKYENGEFVITFPL